MLDGVCRSNEAWERRKVVMRKRGTMWSDVLMFFGLCRMEVLVGV